MNSVQAQSIEKIVALIRANDVKLSDVEIALQYPEPEEPKKEVKEEPKTSTKKK